MTLGRLLILVLTALWAAPAAAEVAADQRQVAIGYERLETLALRIADAVEADDPLRAEQIRTAIGEARAGGLDRRFDKVVTLLERERWAAAKNDQTALATQLEDLLRLVMADPREARLDEERRRLEQLRREIRAALQEQRALRARAGRGEGAELAERQEELANRIERLQEPAEEADRLAGRTQEGGAPSEGGKPAGEGAPQEGQPAGGKPSEGSPSKGAPSISGKLQQGEQAMRQASDKLERAEDAAEEQREAQRRLEEAQREAEERLRQLREEEQQRRLATLAERFRRMHEKQVGVVEETEQRVKRVDAGEAPADSRAVRIAAAQLATKQGEVGAAAEQALRLVRADGSSLVFDDALSQTINDIRAAESRLRAARLDGTTLALERLVADALAAMIAAVDQSLDELEQRQQENQQGPSGGAPPGGDQSLVSRIAELRMIRSIQARLMRQTEVWHAAAQAGEAPRGEVTEKLEQLAAEQARLARSAASLIDQGR